MSALWGAAVAVALGEPAAQVAIRPDACAREERGIDWAAVHRVVELERETAETAPPVAPAVEVTCVPDGVRIQTVPPGPGQPQGRALSLDTLAPSVRDRVLALTIVELLETPPPAAAPTPPANPPPAPTSVEARPWQVDLGPAARWFAANGAWGAGGALGLSHRPRPHLAWRADVDAHGGRVAATGGDVGVVAVSSAGLVLGYGRVGPAELFVGAGVRAGWVRLRGIPREDGITARRFDGAWLGPVAAAGLDLRLPRRLAFAAALEGGYGVIGARARVDGRSGPGAAGPWVSGRLGVGFRW